MWLLCWMLISLRAGALTANEIVCTAWTRDQSESGPILSTKLSPTSYDPDYFEATLNEFTFGADMSFLKEDGLGLIVYDNKNHRFSESTSGFRRIAMTSRRELDLKYYDRRPDGHTIVAGMQCGYSQP